MTFIKPIILSFFLVSLSIQLNAQTNFWTSKTSKSARTDIKTKVSAQYNLDTEGLKKALNSKLFTKEGLILDIPMPDGSFETFQVKPSKVMSPELASKYPKILTFSGKSFEGIEARFDLTPKGFHAMIFGPNGTVFIDPINRTSIASYQSYYKKDYIQKGVALLQDDIFKTEGTKIHTKNRSVNARTSGTELREYRLAVTTTGEYATFHGGTVPDALSAIVTTMNRVNGIYEREVSIRMVLIDDMANIIYTDASTDPYSNGNTSAFINEVQNNIDLVIGTANYDIGHGFSTGAGGLAGPGPCSSTKATGVTGISNPIGDPFDVDFVAHEIGHQFSANHTFNGTAGFCDNANRNSSTAYEPGSGTTILAYAGICSPQNIQNNSDPYFHTASYDEILNYSVNGTGNSCATITSTSNNPPTVDAGEGNFTIPISTPFTLTGSGSDPDGDDLTFSWEQFDLGPASAPNNPSDNAPLFRSFPPKDIPSRTFPDISDIVSNSQTMGELLPSYSRDMTFRLTARDNKDGGGGVNYDEISFAVTEGAGPFFVSSFNSSATLEALNNVTINWDVANTNGSEVDCQSVNILLSEDGGFTFPHTLASSVANNGFATVLIPDVTTTAGRFKIEAADNIFFDINDINVSIVAPTTPGFNISLSTPELTICAPATGQLSVTIGSILNFSDDVTLSVDGLSNGLTAAFTDNPVAPGDATNLTFSDTGLGANGTYELTINATSGAESKSLPLKLNVFDEAIEVIEILSPINGETDMALMPTIIWNGLEGDYNYSLDIATDNAFSNVLLSARGIVDNTFNSSLLNENTTYFLRVKGISECEETDFSIAEFTTLIPSCAISASIDVPVSISGVGTPTITSTLEIAETGFINDLNVLNLIGTHSFINDLTFTLQSPAGTFVTLFGGICSSQNDFNINLDDEAASANYPCPPTDGATYKPSGSLSDFNGQSPTGTWILTVADNADEDGGQLSSWSLEICTGGSVKPNPPSNLSVTSSNNTSTDLTWKDNSADEAGFSIERSTSNNSSFTEIATVSSDITSFNDATISSDFNYFYRVAAIGTSVNSNYSNEEFISFIPFAPSDLIASEITSTSISFFWTDNNPDEDRMVIERSTSGGAFSFLADLNANTVSFTDTGLTPETSYSYRLKAFRGVDESEYSVELNATTLPLPPQAPSNLELDLISVSQINLVWNDNSDNEETFVIERSGGDNTNYNELVSLPTDIDTYQDDDIAIPNLYFYRIKATNSGGDSEYSNEASESTLVLGRDSENSRSINVYPNPSTGLFYLLLPEKKLESNMVIYDFVGNTVTASITNNNGIVAIDLSNYANGLYLLNIQNSSSNYIIRLLKK